MEDKPPFRTETTRGKPRLLPLEIRVARTIRKHGMTRPGDHLLVGVSGGADSTALLICMHRLAPRLGINLSVAHLNHRLRGDESDGDEEFVRRLSADLGRPFASESLDAGKLAAVQGKNLEEAARDARYDFLKRTAGRCGACRIAVGHSMNDQAETVLMRLFRGSGIEGMSAIHPILEGTIIRPLLECRRKDILDYLSDLGIGHREDSSNRDLRFRRNRLRLEWIPSIEKNFNPRLIETLARAAEIARELSDFTGPLALKEYRSLRILRENSIVLPVAGVEKLPAVIGKLVLREALRERRGSLRGVTAAHMEEILRLCRPGQSGRRIQLPGGIVAAREFRELLFLNDQAGVRESFCYQLALPGRCVVREARVEISASFESPPGPQVRSRRVYLDAASLPQYLIVRSRLPGDRYGGSGHRKVKKMLIDAKISLRRRTALPMIAAGDDVIWIPGFEPARPFKAQPESGQCVVLEITSLGR